MFFTPKRRPTAHRLLGRRGRRERARREFAAALLITGIIQAGLALALVVAALVSLRAVQAHARSVDATIRLALPAAFLIGAAVTTRSAVRNLRLSREERAAATKGEDDAG